MQSESKTSEFESIDLSEFIDSNKTLENTVETGIVVLTGRQKVIVDELNQKLAINSPSHHESFTKRMEDLKNLAVSIANFPSLLARANMTADVRTPQDIIESLVGANSYGESFLQLPSKATLGKGFLVAKIHTFSALTKLAVQDNADPKLIAAFKEETVSMMFLLLAEDVYLNLVKDNSLDIDFRRQLATSLLLLWEHRADQNISDISPVLTKVWKARSTLAPAFGTMMGTSELIMFSFQMDEVWSKFIKTQLANPEVSQAMEEFLFGISYEQISRLKRMLREKGISAIGRDEVSKFLGEHVTTDVSGDYKDFYTQYSIRRDNARARKRLNLDGPHRTLEDHFIRFVMEQNREKQNNDSFAK
ncbi:MAG: hypothetical protein IJL34_07580 [Treponema sp.]|nr:hypothetical protein [Treponema sp.]